MDRFIPLNKKSKKEQKKFHSMQRKDWNGLNPATRTVPNGKGYDRNKLKDEERKNGRGFRKEGTCCFYVVSIPAFFAWRCCSLRGILYSLPSFSSLAPVWW